MPLKSEDVDFTMNQARMKLPGSSDSGIKSELFSVVKEFLKDTNAWIEYNRLNVTADVQFYTITPREGGQIIRLVGATDGNGFAVNVSMPEIPTLIVHKRVQVTSIPSSPNDTTLSATSPWRVCIIKNIDLPQTRDQLPICPEFVLKRYSEIILDGILGKMMLEQAKSYTNTQLGMYHLKRYRDGINEARNDAFTQNVFGGQRWSFPQTFSTRSQRGTQVGVWPSETF